MIPAKYWSPTKKLMLLGAMAGGKAVEDTATGNPLAFLTDLAKPLKSLLIPFTPKQTGSGDPSPSNIRPIVPWDGLTVEHGGKNLFDVSNFDWNKGRESDPIYRVNADGTLTVIANDGRAWANLPRVEGLPKGKYVLQWSGTGTLYARYSTDTSVIVSTNGHINLTIDDDNTGFVIKIITSSFPETGTVQIVSGETPLSYEPYKPITETDISFPSPVYGGTLDAVTGVLTVEWASVDMSTMGFSYRSGWNCWVASADSRFETVASNNTATKAITAEAKSVPATGYTASHQNNTLAQNTNGVWFLDNGSTENAPSGLLIVPLATPQEIQLTPAQITALVGNNTIWSDADGSMTAVYFKKA